MFQADGDGNDDPSSAGTADLACQRVRAYFASQREQLKRQEVAALTVVERHIRERLCAIRQHEEDLATVLAQIAEVCVHSERVAKQDDAKLLVEAREIKHMLGEVEAQRAQVAELAGAQLDPSIPITFTKVCNLERS